MKSAFFLDVFVKAVIDSLQGDRFERQDFHQMIGGLINVRVAQHKEHTLRLVVNQGHLGFEDCDAGPLAADQRPGDINHASLIRNELVEVVAGDAAGDFWITRIDERLIALPQRHQLSVDISFAPVRRHAASPVRFGHPSHSHARAVIEQNVEGFDIVDGRSIHLRMGAAGIIAKHSAEAAMIVGGRVGRVGKIVGPRCFHNVVADRPWLHSGKMFGGV